MKWWCTCTCITGNSSNSNSSSSSSNVFTCCTTTIVAISVCNEHRRQSSLRNGLTEARGHLAIASNSSGVCGSCCTGNENWEIVLIYGNTYTLRYYPYEPIHTYRLNFSHQWSSAVFCVSFMLVVAAVIAWFGYVALAMHRHGKSANDKNIHSTARIHHVLYTL